MPTNLLYIYTYIHTYIQHFLENEYFGSESWEISKIIEFSELKNFTVKNLSLKENKRKNIGEEVRYALGQVGCVETIHFYYHY